MSRTIKEKLTVIVDICATANPDICHRADPCAIRRANIVLALIMDTHTRRSEQVITDLGFWWNMSRDFLTSQSDECVGFVFERMREMKFADRAHSPTSASVSKMGKHY